MDDLYNTESFGYDDLLSIGFLMSARCVYSKKYSTIFCTNLWTDFFLIWKFQEDIFGSAPEIDHKEIFLIILAETI